MDALTVTAYKATQPAGVVLSADKCVRTKDATSEYSSIMVTSTKKAMREGKCWKRTRVAHYQELAVDIAGYNVTEGMDFQSVLVKEFGEAFTIVMVESLTPFFVGQTPKMKGKTGVPVLTDDNQFIYHEMQLKPAGSKDELIERTLGGVANAAAPAAAEPLVAATPVAPVAPAVTAPVAPVVAPVEAGDLNTEV